MDGDGERWDDDNTYFRIVGFASIGCRSGVSRSRRTVGCVEWLYSMGFIGGVGVLVQVRVFFGGSSI